MTKSEKKTFILMLLCAVAFLAAGILTLVRATNFIKNGVKTEATITAITYDVNSESYDVTVEFEAEGVIISGSLDAYSSFMHEGDAVTIYYLKDNPRSFSCAKFNKLPFILCTIASLVLFAACVVLFFGQIRNIKLNQLKKSGNRVEATIKEITINGKTSFLGKNPATFTCMDSLHNVYTAKILLSKNESYRSGDKIFVFVDKNNPEKYEIDRNEYISRMKKACL